MGLSEFAAVLGGPPVGFSWQPRLALAHGAEAPSRWRALILSVAVPIVLFGGATAVAEVVSPARGRRATRCCPTSPSEIARRVLGRGLFVAGRCRGVNTHIIEGGPVRDAGSVRDRHRQPRGWPSHSGSTLSA